MRIILETEHSIRLTAGAGDLALEASSAVELSPFHLLAASLGACTWSVLLGWAEAAGLEATGLELVVEWEFGGDPVRVSAFRLSVAWPGLPTERRSAVARAAAHCTVHHTLEYGSRVTTRVESGPGGSEDEGPPGEGPRRPEER
jgi:uncharacterized OsmC-like protein